MTQMSSVTAARCVVPGLVKALKNIAGLVLVAALSQNNAEDSEGKKIHDLVSILCRQSFYFRFFIPLHVRCDSAF